MADIKESPVKENLQQEYKKDESLNEARPEVGKDTVDLEQAPTDFNPPIDENVQIGDVSSPLTEG